MTGWTMISKRYVLNQRRRVSLILPVLLCAAWLKHLLLSAFVVPSSLPEQRVAGVFSKHVVANVDGLVFSIQSPDLRWRHQSSIICSARGGGLISWLRGRFRRNKVPEVDTEAPAPAQLGDETLAAEMAPAPAPEEPVSKKVVGPVVAAAGEADAVQPSEEEEEEEATPGSAATMPVVEAAAAKEVEAAQPSEETDAGSAVPTPVVEAPAAKEAEAAQPSEAAKAGSAVPAPASVAAGAGAPSELLAAFQAFDLDGSGKIDRHELEAAAQRLGKSTDQIGTLLSRFSERGDNEIDFDEFQTLIKEMEGCEIETGECFVLEDPSTWGKLFEFKFD